MLTRVRHTHTHTHCSLLWMLSMNDDFTDSISGTDWLILITCQPDYFMPKG